MPASGRHPPAAAGRRLGLVVETPDGFTGIISVGAVAPGNVIEIFVVEFRHGFLVLHPYDGEDRKSDYSPDEKFEENPVGTCAQGLERLGELVVDRAFGNAHPGGNLGVRQTVALAQQQDLPPLRRQRIDGRPEPGPDKRAVNRLLIRHIFRQHLHRD